VYDYGSSCGFESISGQEQPVRILTTLLRRKTIPHALLFTGTEGIGKKTAASVFALACNCSENPHVGAFKTPGSQYPCGNCKSCRKIMSGNHPDIIEIKPSGQFIRIAQIRSLCETLAMKPYEAVFRIVIISDAQAMNAAAANALLKVLEEPPDNTIIILTAPQILDLLPTIVSRCRHLQFNPLFPDTIAEMLMEKNDYGQEDANIVAAMANGSYSKAIDMSDKDWKNRRKWLISASGLENPGSLFSRPLVENLLFARKLSQNKELLFDSLELIKSWLRDLIIYKYSPDKIINKDLTEKIQYASQAITVKALLEMFKAVRSAQTGILANANLRLTLEIMLLQMAKNEPG